LLEEKKIVKQKGECENKTPEEKKKDGKPIVPPNTEPTYKKKTRREIGGEPVEDDREILQFRKTKALNFQEKPMEKNVIFRGTPEEERKEKKYKLTEKEEKVKYKISPESTEKKEKMKLEELEKKDKPKPKSESRAQSRRHTPFGKFQRKKTKHGQTDPDIVSLPPEKSLAEKNPTEKFVAEKFSTNSDKKVSPRHSSKSKHKPVPTPATSSRIWKRSSKKKNT